MATERPPAVRATHAPNGLVILGDPVLHSLSPRFQNAALAHERLAVRYERRAVPRDQLDTVLADCRAANVGGNVTIPHKEAVAERAGRLTARARRAGAVNTFWWEAGTLVGHNTDVDGVLATVGALVPHGVRGPVVLLGSGGSAAAVLVALDELGIEHVHIGARTRERAAALAHRVGIRATVHDYDANAPHQLESFTALLTDATLVINTTPAGMRDGAQPLPASELGPRTAVFDLVYRQDGTPWIRAAHARGLLAEDGLRMLVEQGAAAFETWFDRPAPRAVMWAALDTPMPAPDRARS